MNKRLIITMLTSLLHISLYGQSKATEQDQINTFKSFDWKLPEIHKLPKSNSILSLPNEHIALLGEDAKNAYMICEGINNDSVEAVVFTSDMDECIWFINSDSGYVHLNDWEKLNADELWKVINENTDIANEERRKKGLSEIHVIGWLQPPTLDRHTNTVYWAIEGEAEEAKFVNSVAIRLGRKGYEKLIWVTNISSYIAFGGELDIMLRAHSFKSGFRYKDYTNGDRIANYGIVTLISAILGAKVAKTGGLYLLLKKIAGFIVAAIAALFYKFKNFFKNKKD
jgi:uncharacterized membrane-anchored protein